MSDEHTTTTGPVARLVVTATPTGLDFTAEVNGGDGWVSVQTWRKSSTAAGAARRRVISDSARAQGWLVPEGEWPRFSRAGRLVLDDAAPQSWLAVVEDVTARRQAVLAEYADIDRTWRGVITAAVDGGWSSVTAIASAAGVGRHRVHQLKRESAPHDLAAAATQAIRHNTTAPDKEVQE